MEQWRSAAILLAHRRYTIAGEGDEHPSDPPGPVSATVPPPPGLTIATVGEGDEQASVRAPANNSDRLLLTSSHIHSAKQQSQHTS